MVCLTKLFTSALLATTALAAPMTVQKRASSKRGAAYNDPTTVAPLDGAVTWAYNWAATSFGTLPSGVEYVPMLWGSKDFGNWATIIQTVLASGSNYILGFNEPDMPSQASMSPGDAAHNYKNYITPYAGQAKLISPAVSSSTSPGMGLDWFKSFMSQCSSCEISGLAVHWYGNTAEQFKSFVQEAISTAQSYGLSEVWVTEFALNSDVSGTGNPKATNAFLHEVLPWLDSQPMVSRYSYFMCAENYLVSGNALNSVGATYVA